MNGGCSVANKEDDEAVYKVIEDSALGLVFVSIITRLKWHPHDDARRLDKSLSRLKRAKRIKFVNQKAGWVLCTAEDRKA